MRYCHVSRCSDDSVTIARGLSQLPGALEAKPFRQGFPPGRITRKQAWRAHTFLPSIAYLKFMSTLCHQLQEI